ncbi:MAG: aminotransferase class V-fold PLP-dependent enzyme [Verrucomicrobiota bacterium]|nr:aminotransferase class V-fold PLP-dependent enzyme [Verrucomicrobiota bacterium]
MSGTPRIYFDNNATTRVAPAVVEAMLPYLTEQWGNPSSPYQHGRVLVQPIDAAREKVAALIHADTQAVVFTSCGTESINTAINSALLTQPGKRHCITTAVEHSATLKCCEALVRRGYEVTILPVETDGSLDLKELECAIRPDTAIVSTLWANNETGVLFPVEEIAAICRKHHVLYHIDAVQTPGKLDIDVETLGVDFLSLSAHKLNGPKGIGLLYVKPHTPFWPHLLGGQQEQGRRGGTENVPYIIAFGKAAELAMQITPAKRSKLAALRDRLESGLLQRIEGSTRNGNAAHRLPNTTNLAFVGVESEAVLMLLDQLGICVSSGSACTTGSAAPSHVLTAMGLNAVQARGSLRFSLGFESTEAEVDYVLEQLPAIIETLRIAASPRKYAVK